MYLIKVRKTEIYQTHSNTDPPTTLQNMSLHHLVQTGKQIGLNQSGTNNDSSRAMSDKALT
jgi:hypothetical protein